MSDEHLDPATLQAYRMGQVSASEVQRIEAHLASCGACRKQLTATIRPAADVGVGLEHRAPPSVEVPETYELREVPSQVSVMKVPHTVEAGDRPSVTSINTGMEPLARPAPPRRRRGGAIVAAVALMMLVVFSLAVIYVGFVRPHARSASQTRRAEALMQPVLQDQRLAELQHPALRGQRPYRPGADADIEQALAEAEALLERAVRADSGNVDARMQLALIQLMHGEAAAARGHYQEVEATLGPTPSTRIGLGVLDYLAGAVAPDDGDRQYALQQAAARFAEVRLGDPGYPESIYNRAVVAHALGDAAEAARLQGVFAELQPGSPWNEVLSGLLGGAG